MRFAAGEAGLVGCATVDEQLFETDSMAVAPPPTSEKGPVARTFRAYDPDQVLLMPPSLADWLPEDHLAHFVSELVDEVLDLGPFLASYTEVRGYPPYDPRLMLKILLYGYTKGVRSSRRIEVCCQEDVAFRFLAGNCAPDYRSIARFRKRHLAALEGLFVQPLRLCQQAGMVTMGRVALDGTKVRANASRHKAMSYDRMVRAEQDLADEVARMMADAQRIDEEEDARFGPDERGGDLSGEMARRESRLAKIRSAKDDLERHAREAAAAAAREKAAKTAQNGGDVDVEVLAEQAARDARPAPKAQRNFTDPDARIMKTADGSFHYAYNAQAVVDEDNQVIIATDFAESGADCPALPQMLDQAIANTGSTPGQTLADAGYFSAANVRAATTRRTDPLIATGRLKHGDTVPDTPPGPAPTNATPKQAMAYKLRTEQGKAAYSRRKVIVEPVFGQMKTTQHAGQLLLRGRDNARAEWRLLAACHNLRTLFRFQYGTIATPATA